jgi:cytoskeletal protein RodZ
MQPDSLEPRWNETMPVGSEATVTPVPTVGSTPLPGTPAVPPPDPSNPETTSPGRLSLPELAAEASLHGARISLVDEAQQKDSRFRMLVLAGAVVLAIIGGIGVWRLTAPADDGTATNPDANATSAPTNATPTATPTPPATATATATATASAKATATATASAKATPKSTTRKPSRPPTVARPPRTTTSKPASGPQLKKPTFD